MNGQRRGIDRERSLRAYLERQHWLVIRAAGSLGPADLIAIATRRARFPAGMVRGNAEIVDVFAPERGEILLFECKSTSGGPYERFGPADREELREIAESIGAAAWLAWKPKGARLWTFTHSLDWPRARTPFEEVY